MSVSFVQDCPLTFQVFGSSQVLLLLLDRRPLYRVTDTQPPTLYLGLSVVSGLDLSCKILVRTRNENSWGPTVVVGGSLSGRTRFKDCGHGSSRGESKFLLV